ncbi:MULTISPECIES: hypothetical protein [Erysipelothrix]|uniref:Uncharacterized protein n=1 Tax=Erysipelothrix piscisicarius TaxID=2485784 RepID=A0A451ENT5_9FIRM|nr:MULTISPECIES: hypothetical protein [Erysipelothrix]AZK43556.1 hypothetical protein EEI45_00960 [Erysipelothrix piscisicarius]MBK2402720.1 hypothetical protein [Erysipelothrix sp. strain 2 (EsS2-6-Brazil)]MBK2403549.1 hypothetical protein [Erysipelothrix sp. strain 2 (EsS2-7-Brazil)]NBA01594.1 hypothetical protein [Erysipelothrix rhusiopathiae]
MEETKKIKRRIFLSVFVLIVACACLYFLVTFEASASPQEFPLESGNYIVGTDLEPGEYMLLTDQEGYFEIRNQNATQIKSNDNFKGNSIITLKENETIEVSKARLYPYATSPKLNPQADGMYKIGEHLEAGTYKLQTELSGYYEITTTSNHNVDDILENNNFTDPVTIYVKDGEYLKLNSASILERPSS